jgi:ribosomal-protein-alanine N-acetyltransferase
MIIVQTSDSEVLAALHALCFNDAWSGRSFEQLLGSGAVALVANENEVRSCGFVLFRLAADEAEILSLGVEAEHRGRGVGRALILFASKEIQRLGGSMMFLEVSKANAPALALYLGLGFVEAGGRRDYYAPGDDAVVLKALLPLTPS